MCTYVTCLYFFSRHSVSFEKFQNTAQPTLCAVQSGDTLQLLTLLEGKNDFHTSPVSVVVHLTRLFNLILKHGYVPIAFGEEKVVSVIKDKHGDICFSDN